MRIQVNPSPTLQREVLRGDEELFSRAESVVRVGRFAEDCVSVGVGQRDGERVLFRAHALGLSGARRTSGGSSLLHLKGDVYWSLVLPRSHPWARTGFVRRFAELGGGWSAWGQARGLPLEWSPAPGTEESYCLLSSRGQVVSCEGRVLGGASQHVNASALLHHGVVSARLDLGRLSQLFPEVQGGRFAALTSLEGLGLDLDTDDVGAIAQALARAVRAPLEDERS